MYEIKQLDNKYLVIKTEDLDNYIGKGFDRDCFEAICKKVEHLRKRNNKPTNRYVVLNLDDEINLGYLVEKIKFHEYQNTWNNHTGYKTRVKHIAVVLVNAILKAKQERE